MLHLISNEESALKRANTFAHERATTYICSQMSHLSYRALAQWYSNALRRSLTI
jgi:hypothetical protein